MITFFTGKTFDGFPWILSFEGGPTATDPGAACVVTGMVATLRVAPLTAAQGSDLRAILPGLDYAEVELELRRLRRRRAA